MSEKVRKKVDVNLKKIFDLLKKHQRLTIIGLVRESNLSGATVRIALARLEEKDIVSFEKVGMAKVFSLKKGQIRNLK